MSALPPKAVLLCLALGIAIPAAARADVAEFLGKRVTQVRLALEGRETSDPVLIDLVETRVG